MSSLRGMLLTPRSSGISGEMDMVGLESIDSNQSVLEAEAADRQIAELDVNIERLADIVEGLETLRETAEMSLEDGGLDRTSALMLTVGADALLKPLEVKAPCPGMESFGGYGERLGATRVAVESIGTVLADIWKAIKQAVESMRKKIVQWYKSIYDASTKIKNRADKIIEQAKKITGAAKEKDFEFAIHNIAVGKEVKDLAKQLEAMTKQADNVLVSRSGQLVSVTGKAKDAIKDMDVSSAAKVAEGMVAVAAAVSEAVNTNLKALLGESYSTEADGTKQKNYAKGNGVTYYQGEVMPGNRMLFLGQITESNAPDGQNIGLEEKELSPEEIEAAKKAKEDADKNKGDAGGAKALSDDEKAKVDSAKKILDSVIRVGYKLGSADETLDKEDGTENTPTPTANEIMAIAEACGNLAVAVGKFKAGSEKLDKEKVAVMKVGDDFSKKAAKCDISGATAALSSVQKLPKELCAMLDNPANLLVKVYVTVANQALNYCQAALAQYK